MRSIHWRFLVLIAYLGLPAVSYPLKSLNNDTMGEMFDGQLSNRVRRLEDNDTVPSRLRRFKITNEAGSPSAIRRARQSIEEEEDGMLNLPKLRGKTGKPGFLDKIKPPKNPFSQGIKILITVLIVVGSIFGVIGLCVFAACVYFCCIRGATGGEPQVIIVGKKKKKRGQVKAADDDEGAEEEEEEEEPEPTTKKKSKATSKSKSKSKLKSKSRALKSKAKSKSKTKTKTKKKKK